MKPLLTVPYIKAGVALALFLGAGSLAPVRGAGLTESDKKLWVLCIKRVKMKPPCCGACKLLTQQDAKALWQYISSEDALAKKKHEALWMEHKAKLLEEFKHLSPERYQALYGGGDK